MTDPHDRHEPARRDDEPSRWSRRVPIGIAVVLVPELLSNVVANAFSDTQLGQWLRYHIAAVVVVIGVVVACLFLGLFVVDRRRGLRAPDRKGLPAPDDVVMPEPQPLPPWYQFPTRLHGRDRECEKALRALRSRGVVAIVGPRDVGTSSVANRVVARLVKEDHIASTSVVWVDLRGRSSTEPPVARSVAGRLLSTFDLDEPADGTPAVLADAAHRLVSALSARTTVLLLDNVFNPGQVAWLTQAWPVGDNPLLVVVGDDPVATSVSTDCAVHVDALDLSAMRAILSDEAGDRFLRRALRVLIGGRPAPVVDELLTMFSGRPRAVRDIARVVRTVEVGEWSLNLSNDRSALSGNGTAPMVRIWAAVLPQLLAHLSPDAVELLRALAVLPVTGLERDAVDALLPTDCRGDPVGELCTAVVVQCSADGRFRLPEEVRLALWSVEGQACSDTTWDAVARLVRYYAVHATSYAAALRKAAEARSALMWLHKEEPLLGALLTDWRPEPEVPTRLLDDLAMIADALDTWYTRELLSDGLLRTSTSLAALAERAGRPELVRLARLRIAAAHRIGAHLGAAADEVGSTEPQAPSPAHPAASALRARWYHERALIEFDGTTAVHGDQHAVFDRLTTAEGHLAAAGAAVPADDTVGDVCVLVNLAAVCLARLAHLSAEETDPETRAERRQRSAAASAYLDSALSRVGADSSANAHVVELQGVLAFRENRDREAVVHWQKALGVYRELREEQGQARCLQHLGTLALTRPGVLDQLAYGAGVPENRHRAALVARRYLAESRHLRAGQPTPTLADHYLAIVDQRLPRSDE